MKFFLSLAQRDLRLLWLKLGAVSFPLLLALSLSQLVPPPLQATTLAERVTLQSVQAESAEQLEQLFAGHGYTWPPRQAVPALGVQFLPADLAGRGTAEKKSLFFRILLPLVVAENRRLREQRQWLLKLAAQEEGPGEEQRLQLQTLAAEYGLEGEEDEARLRRELLLRIDEVPPGLVLAQAANESAWGTSRFAREANNLFGEWTFIAEHGVVPRVRNEESRHYVRRFDDLRHSVRSYLHNLNSGRAYKRLRELRAAMREQGMRLNALVLAGGLRHYSARGEEYVEEIRAMIDGNALNDLGPLHLARLATAD